MTTNVWVPVNPYVVKQAINTFDTTQWHPYGTIVRAFHATFGQGEFIYLQGVASTAVGSLVNYVGTTGVTSLTTGSGANVARPVAVAMSANIVTTTYGWYQIDGSATILKTAFKVDPAITHATNVYLSATSGRVMQTSVAGRTVLGANFETATTVTSTTSTAVVTINRPHQQGPIT